MAHLIFMCLTLLFYFVTGSVVEFQATPTQIKAGLTSSVVLHCGLNDTSDSGQIVGKRDVERTVENMQEVTSLILMHDGQDIASVSHLHPPHDMTGAANVKVTGSLTPTSGQTGYIEVRLEYPSEAQSGEFVCEVNAVSDSGHVVTFSRSLEVVAMTPTIDDLVTHIRDLSIAMKTSQAAHDHEISQLKANNTALVGQVRQLQSVTHPNILFSAGLTKDLSLTAGQVLVLDKIYANLGGAYRPSSGEFVCQTSGYYLLSVSALSDNNQVFWLDVQLNGQHQFAIYGPSSHSHMGSSNSAILLLTPGDKVSVVAVYQSTLTNRPDEIYTTFRGHLLALA